MPITRANTFQTINKKIGPRPKKKYAADIPDAPAGFSKGGGKMSGKSGGKSSSGKSSAK